MSTNFKKLLLLAFLSSIVVALVTLTGQAKPGTMAKITTVGASVRPTAPTSSTGPIVGQAVNFGETIAARDLPDAEISDDAIASFAQQGGEEKNELNAAQVKTQHPTSGKSVDSTLKKNATKKSGGAVTVTGPGAPIVTFDGISDADNTALIGGQVAPSDENVAVGPNHVVQVVNDGFRVWDKSGTPLMAAKLISKLFASIGGACGTLDRGDPVVQHDRMSGRWVISQFNFASSTAAPFHECIAVSKTSDPTGSYYAYDFITPGNEFPDYPKLGTWPDGYYMTVNQFTNGAAFNGVGVYAFDRQKMLVGDATASFIYFSLNLTTHPEGIYAMQPSDMDGFQLPPPNAPNVFAYEISDEYESPPFNVDALRLFNFHADFSPGGSPSFTERAESPLPVSPYDPRYPQYNFNNNGRADIKQPAPAASPSMTSNVPGDYLDSIGYHLMYRLQYRNLNGNEYLVASTTCNVSGVDPSNDVAAYQAAVRYFQLTKTSAGGAYSLYDDATFSPDAGTPLTGLNRWLPSAAIDGQGNLAVSYSTSSTSVFPSIAYAGRDSASTGSLTGEQTLFAGTAVQLGSGNRWGDYQSLQVDPSDDCTFWTTDQYYNTNSSFNWRTRIGSFKFASCTAPSQGTLSGTITTCDTGAPIAGAIVQISNGFSGATLPDGTFSINLPPGSYTATVVSPSQACTASATSNVTITNGSTTTLNQCLSGLPLFAYQSVAVSGGTGGSGVINAFECDSLNVTIVNQGCATSANTSAVLSTTTPGVTITQPNSAYPNAAEQATSTNTTPFTVSTSNQFACGTPISFTLTVSFTGGSSMFNFSVPTCATTPTVINDSLSTSDSTQTGRLGRNAGSVCGSQKACPGALDTAHIHHYKTYTVPNGPTAACVTISVTPSCNQTTNPIVVKAHLNSYDPANFCTNYLGDSGTVAASGPTSFAVNLAANATMILVVEDSGNQAGTGCSGYQLSISGLSGFVPGTGSCGAPTVNSIKMHASFGPFGIPMPLLGPSGVEDRIGNNGVAGSHTLDLTFPSSPVGTTISTVSSNPAGGTGTVSNVTYNGNDMILTLTNVSDRQVLNLTTSGGPFGTITVPVGFLVGDVNGSRSVSNGDITGIKNLVGTMTITNGNFRYDVDANGMISNADVTDTKPNTGAKLP